jgi:ABC-type multidrug transport system ATPase subunit
LASAEISQTTPVVVLDKVSKLFGRFAALREVSASFAPGKLYAIVGENGAGKSTLMRIIAGLAQPTRGMARLFGTEDREQFTARIGYMGHSSMLYDELSGAENLRYFGALYSEAAASSANIDAAMRIVGLDPKLLRRVSAYSQGMRQRLALARALIHGPELLLLDEPFSNVDVASTRAMAELLGKVRDSGKTIFVITHQAEILAAIADETITLSNGELVARSARSSGQDAMREVTR